MKEAIRNFPAQFSYQPRVKNGEKLGAPDRFVVFGMGGSALAADIMRAAYSNVPLLVYRDYGLPAQAGLPVVSDLQSCLFIASSYSGNTEEMLDGYDSARSQKLNLCVVASGGKLLEKAKDDGMPYIQLPATGIQPRMAIGYSFLALAKLLARDDIIAEAQGLERSLNSTREEALGKELAEKIAPRVPVIYASLRNEALAYNWKIMFNETGKIPAFYNVFPELNHNEINGFEVHPRSRDFHFLLFRDSGDHPRIQRRMEVLQKLYQDRGLSVGVVAVDGASRLEKIFANFLRGAWTAYYTAKHYGADPTDVPIIEEFKSLL